MADLITLPDQTTSLSSSATYAGATLGMYSQLVVEGTDVDVAIQGEATTTSATANVIVEDGATLDLEEPSISLILNVSSGSTLRLDGQNSGVTVANDATVVVGDSATQQTFSPTGIADYSGTTLTGFQAGDVIEFDSPAVSFSVTAPEAYPYHGGVLQPAGTLDVDEQDGTSVVVAFNSYGPSISADNFAIQNGTIVYQSDSQSTLTSQIVDSTSSAGIITDNPTPMLSGSAAPGASITILSDGATVGSTVADATVGAWSATLSAPLGTGIQQLTAESPGNGETASPLNLLVLPAPVNGISVADESSADLSGLLGQGYSLQFTPATEAVQLTNGTLSVGPDTSQAFLQRLYEGLLSRGGDPGGLATFDEMLGSGTSQADVATDILDSPEYAALHGSVAAMSNIQFVTSLYTGFLGRAPDQGGLTFWDAALVQGTTPGQVVAAFAQSSDARANLAADTASVWVPNADGELVTQLYQTGLGHDPDLGGLQFWSQALQGGLTPAQLAADLVASPEFQSDHAGQDSATLVSNFYSNALGRAPDVGGSQFWVGALQSGAGQAAVLFDIGTSPAATAHLSPAV